MITYPIWNPILHTISSATVFDYLAGTRNEIYGNAKAFSFACWNIIKLLLLYANCIAEIFCDPCLTFRLSFNGIFVVETFYHCSCLTAEDKSFFFNHWIQTDFACETSYSMFLDVIRDHCSEEKDKHLSFPQSDTRLILGAWAHMFEWRP